MGSDKAFLAIAAVFLLTGAALVGCNNYKAPTSPYGGGSTSGSGGSGSGNTPFESGTMSAPATFVHTFPAAGAVGYHCRFHVGMGMVGTVTVAAGAADSAVVVASGTTFAPPAVTIRPGGYVHWNVTNGTHTVTSN